jgi:gingipain R
LQKNPYLTQNYLNEKFIMKKFILFFLAFFFTFLNINAQNQQIVVGSNYVNPNEVTLVVERGSSTTIKFALNELNLIEVETDYGLALIPTSNKAPLMLQEGTPELFYLTTSFIIPDRGGSELEISYGQFQDFENIEIAPSKGHILRNTDPNTVPYVKGDVFERDAFFPGTLASLREPFIVRDMRGQSVDIFPVQYNPVTKTLRVYAEITVTVVNTKGSGINEFTTQKRHKTVEPQYNDTYSYLFINHSEARGQRGFPTGEEGELLIICHSPFVDALQPYIDWKRTIGRKTTIVPTSATGTTATAIKSYILNYYNDPDKDLAYVLFVGNNSHIPLHSVNVGDGTTRGDVFYGQLVGTDPYLEVLIGRFISNTVADVETQVQRSIWYEQDITTTDTWLATGWGGAARECGGHYGECDDQHIDAIRGRMLTYGYTTVHQAYTGVSGIPNATAASISQNFNDGVSIANYCNHGSKTAWTYYHGLQYTNSHVNQLQNAGKLPFIYSVACVNGQFQTSGACFAETWMRATHNNQPTGAVSFFGSTRNLWWIPPMAAQDIFANITMDLPPPYGFTQQPGTNRTIAGAMLNSSQMMMAVLGTTGQPRHDYEGWLVFGDPTLQFRTKTPQEMVVSYLPVLLGATELPVECDVEGALAAASYIDDEGEVIILGTALVEEGIADIVFDEPLPETVEEVTLAVTAFNKVTVVKTIVVVIEFELPAPLNLSYTVENANHVILEWTEPDGKGLTVAGYNVYRDDELITPEPVKDENTYTDIVPANGVYQYEITALYGTSLESDPSDPVTVTIDGMCIPIGKNITVVQTEGANILVSWTAPAYEGIEHAGYNVYRNDEQINEDIIPADQITLLDEDLEPEAEYCYYVEVVYNDCEDTYLSDEECKTIVSVKELSGQAFQIFPNPASSELNIVGNVVPIYVSIYSNMGQLMYENNQCTTNMKISVSSLSAGIYFIRIDSEEGSIMRKIVVNN